MTAQAASLQTIQAVLVQPKQEDREAQSTSELDRKLEPKQWVGATKKLLGAKGIATRSKGLTTSNKKKVIRIKFN